MASSLAALPKSSPDYAVCLAPFTLDAELRLLPARCHAFHVACVDAWLRTSPSFPLCHATITLPHPSISTILAAEQPPPLEPRNKDRSRSFRVQMSSVSNRSSSTQPVVKKHKRWFTSMSHLRQVCVYRSLKQTSWWSPRFLGRSPGSGPMC
ncbi:hypothetical protein ABZP36_030198 [Zizania latifolia]